MSEPLSDDSRLYLEAADAFRAGRHEQAIVLLEQSLATSPHYKTAELLAMCHLQCGRPDIALDLLERAHGLNEKSSRTACLLAEQLLRAGDQQRARTIVANVLRRQSDYGPAMQILERLRA